VQHNRAGQLPALEGEGPALAGATEPEGISQLRGEDGGWWGDLRAEGPGEHKPSSFSWTLSPSIPFPCKWSHWFLQAADSTSFTAPTVWAHLVKFSSFWKLGAGERRSSMATFKAWNSWAKKTEFQEVSNKLELSLVPQPHPSPEDLGIGSSQDLAQGQPCTGEENAFPAARSWRLLFAPFQTWAQTMPTSHGAASPP